MPQAAHLEGKRPTLLSDREKWWRLGRRYAALLVCNFAPRLESSRSLLHLTTFVLVAIYMHPQLNRLHDIYCISKRMETASRNLGVVSAVFRQRVEMRLAGGKPLLAARDALNYGSQRASRSAQRPACPRRQPTSSPRALSSCSSQALRRLLHNAAYIVGPSFSEPACARSTD